MLLGLFGFLVVVFAVAPGVFPFVLVPQRIFLGTRAVRGRVGFSEQPSLGSAPAARSFLLLLCLHSKQESRRDCPRLPLALLQHRVRVVLGASVRLGCGPRVPLTSFRAPDLVDHCPSRSQPSANAALGFLSGPAIAPHLVSDAYDGALGFRFPRSGAALGGAGLRISSVSGVQPPGFPHVMRQNMSLLPSQLRSALKAHGR